MALHITDRSITSDLTPEAAYFVPDPGGGGKWLLTWFPDRLLTREQAIDGMTLDELLSDPRADATTVASAAAVYANSLGMELADVLVRLYTRAVERDRRSTRRTRGPRRHGPRRTRDGVPQWFLLFCATVSAMLARTLYAVVILPSLSFVLAALLTARVA
ncbi:hypothetical protein [Nocardia concava]|uniref:hypothetical protein n=1 Tax=Nocardia concava TaxID=257281 RepID=UPI0003165D67|nr:hypothetical protein [Nocardia concava]